MDNIKIKELIKFVVIFFVMYWLFSIVKQVLPHRGVVGVSLSNSNSCKSEVAKLYKDMPAIISGIQLNDCIIKVDNIDVSDKNYYYVVSKIKGKTNTNVSITVKRDEEIINYNLTRVKNKIDWFNLFK